MVSVGSKGTPKGRPHVFGGSRRISSVKKHRPRKLAWGFKGSRAFLGERNLAVKAFGDARSQLPQVQGQPFGPPKISDGPRRRTETLKGRFALGKCVFGWFWWEPNVSQASDR